MRMPCSSAHPWLGAAAITLALAGCFEDPAGSTSSSSGETGDGDGDPGDGDPGDGDGDPGDGDGDPGDGDGDPGDGDGDSGDGDGDPEPGAYRWHVTYPGYPTGIAAYPGASADSVLVVGTLIDTWETPGATLVPEQSDVLVMGLAADGAIDWARALGGSGRENAMDLAVYGDARFAVSVLYSEGASSFGGPVFPAPTGNNFNGALLGAEGPGLHAWSIGLTGTNVFPRGVDVNGSSQVVATGYFGVGPLVFGGLDQTSAANNQVFFARLDSVNDNPAPMTLTQYGGLAADEGVFALYDGFGGIYLGGNFRDNMSLGGVEYAALGGADVFVARVDNAGLISAIGLIGGPEDDFVTDATVDAAGNLILTGSFAGTLGYQAEQVGQAMANRDGFVIELDPGLGLIDGWALASPGNVIPRRVEVGPNGDLAIGGEASGGVDLGTGLLPAIGNADGWVVRYDSAGTPIWAELYGSNADDRVSAVGFDAQGRLLFGLIHFAQVTLAGGAVLENDTASARTSIVAVE